MTFFSYRYVRGQGFTIEGSDAPGVRAGWPLLRWRGDTGGMVVFDTNGRADYRKDMVNYERIRAATPINLLVCISLVIGTMATVEKWCRSALIRPRMSPTSLIASVAFVGCWLGLNLYGVDSLWTVVTMATGVLLVGIFLTCFAVIDWIGGVWSLATRATRRLVARSAPVD